MTVNPSSRTSNSPSGRKQTIITNDENDDDLISVENKSAKPFDEMSSASLE